MDPYWISVAFSFVNSVRVVFYVPQIVAVARSSDGARDIALSTWAMWALTNGLGAAYGAWVVHDPWLALSFGLCMGACIATLALTVAKRLRFRSSARRRGLGPPFAGRGHGIGMTNDASGSQAAEVPHPTTPGGHWRCHTDCAAGAACGNAIPQACPLAQAHWKL